MFENRIFQEEFLPFCRIKSLGGGVNGNDFERLENRYRYTWRSLHKNIMRISTATGYAVQMLVEDKFISIIKTA